MIKNPIAFGSYLGGFFFEIELWVNQRYYRAMGGPTWGGKVTRGFVMKDLAQLLVAQKANTFRKENNICEPQVQESLSVLRFLKTFPESAD